MKICYSAGPVTGEENYFRIKTDGAEVRVWFLTDHILRVRAGFDGDWDEASYSLVMTAWESRTDEFMKTERKKVITAPAALTDGPGEAVLTGRALRVVVHKDPFYLSVFDREGTLLHEDIPDLAYREDGNGRRLHAARIENDDHFYGFGEKTGPLDKAGEFMSMAPGDSLGYDPARTDSLYKHIPFYIKLQGASRKAVGYFYHTTAECTFNMGRELRNYWHRHSTFCADSGDVDLFLIAGPAFRDVIRRYTDLTGKSAMLPRAALGYLGSSMYYPELPRDCDEAVVSLVDTAREEGIPMDGFHLSSGYCAVETPAGIKRCSFTWNRRRFKAPAAWFSQMKTRGILVSANVKPGMLLIHPLLGEMKARHMFLTSSPDAPEGKGSVDGLAVGTWWGGKGLFVDFTRPAAREAWKEYLKKSLLEYGCESIWNDNCEYDSIVDKDAPVDYEGWRGADGPDGCSSGVRHDAAGDPSGHPAAYGCAAADAHVAASDPSGHPAAYGCAAAGAHVAAGDPSGHPAAGDCAATRGLDGSLPADKRDPDGGLPADKRDPDGDLPADKRDPDGGLPTDKREAAAGGNAFISRDRRGTIGALKSVMPGLMCRLSNEASLEVNPGVRPFSVCRSGHAGIQRYAQVWAGDNETSWETLRYNIATILGMGLSGVANNGCDIGGFYGPAPEAELFVRWVQNGIFQPRFSIHSTNTDNTVTEPWMYSDMTGYIRDAIRFRYRMSPYLYSLMYRAHVTGLPIMEPLVSAFTNDPLTWQESVDFMWGDSLLAATVVEKGQTVRPVYLPEIGGGRAQSYESAHSLGDGSRPDGGGRARWYDFYTREPYEPGTQVRVPVGLGSVPLFVKSGAIVPMSAEDIMSLSREKVRHLKVLLAPDVDGEFEMYEDDGISNDYLAGVYRKTRIEMKAGVRTVISFRSEGTYESAVENVELDVICRERAPYYVLLDGAEMKHFLHRKKFEVAGAGWYYSQRLRSVIVRYPVGSEDGHEVTIGFERFDLIGM